MKMFTYNPFNYKHSFNQHVYLKTLVFFPVQWHFALDPSCFIINFKEAFGVLVNPGSLQLVYHLSGENLVGFNLREWNMLELYEKQLICLESVRITFMI